MRDLTKSMMSCGWAMSVFGVQQMMNVVMPGQGGKPCDKAAKAFNDVTNAVVNTLDGSLKSTFEAGENMQTGMVEMMFGGIMQGGADPGRWMHMWTDTLQNMASFGKRVFQTAAGSTGDATASGTPGATGAGASSSTSGGHWGPMPR